MLKKFENLLIKCDESVGSNVFDLFCKKVIHKFPHINDWFDVGKPRVSLSLVSKDTLDTIAKEKSITYKNINVPKWLTGFSNTEEAWMVIPTLETLDKLCEVALHELIHLLSYKLDASHQRIKLLDEGIAIFLSNQYANRIYTPWVEAYLKNNLPKVSDFCTYDGMEFSQKRRVSVFLSYHRIFNKLLW